MVSLTFTDRDRELGGIAPAVDGPAVVARPGGAIPAPRPYGACERSTKASWTILDALDMDDIGDIEIDFTRRPTRPCSVTFD